MTDLTLEQVRGLLAELDENPSPPEGPFDRGDIEIFWLLARQSQLDSEFDMAPGWFAEMATKLEGTLSENDRLRKALQDAINCPKWVVPESAEPFIME